MAFDVFMSYSHEADDDLCEELQRRLQQFAKPWYRRRSMRVFRDESGLSANPDLWASIVQALSESAWFVLVASEHAAASDWVNKEVTWWRTNRSADRMLIVLTDGYLLWDPVACDFAPGSTCIPAALDGAFKDEPRYVDARGVRAGGTVDLENGQFRDAIADVAATVRGVPKDELIGDDLRLHRRALRTAYSAVILLLALLAASVFGAVVAMAQTATAHRSEQHALDAKKDALTQKSRADVNAKEAERQAAEAKLQRKHADEKAAEAKSQRKIAEAQAAEAKRQRKNAETQAGIARANATRADEKAKEAKTEASIAKAKTAEAKAQTAEANLQRLLADQAAEKARQAQAEAIRQAAIAEVRRIAAQQAEADARKANADLQVANDQLKANQAVLKAKDAEITKQNDELVAKNRALDESNASLAAETRSLDASRLASLALTAKKQGRYDLAILLANKAVGVGGAGSIAARDAQLQIMQGAQHITGFVPTGEGTFTGATDRFLTDVSLNPATAAADARVFDLAHPSDAPSTLYSGSLRDHGGASITLDASGTKAVVQEYSRSLPAWSIWDLAGAAPKEVLPLGTAIATSFNDDDSQMALLVQGNGLPAVEIVDITSAKVMGTWTVSSLPVMAPDHLHFLSRDALGRWIVSDERNPALSITLPATPDGAQPVFTVGGAAVLVQTAPDRLTEVASDDAHPLRTITIRPFSPDPTAPRPLAVDDADQRVATASADGIHITRAAIDATTDLPLPRTQCGAPSSIAFSDSGRWLRVFWDPSLCSSTEVDVDAALAGLPFRPVDLPVDATWAIVEGHYAVNTSTNTIDPPLIDLETGAVPAQLAHAPCAVRGTTSWIACGDQVVDLATTTFTEAIPHLVPGVQVSQAAFTASGKLVLDSLGTVVLVDPFSSAARHSLLVLPGAVSEWRALDSQSFARLSSGGTQLDVVDSGGHRTTVPIASPRAGLQPLGRTAAGDVVLSAYDGWEILDPRTGATRTHDGRLDAVSSDGRTIAYSPPGASGITVITTSFEPILASPLPAIYGPPEVAPMPVISSDGRFYGVAYNDNPASGSTLTFSFKVLDLRTGRQVLAGRARDIRAVPGLEFSPDGTRLVVGRGGRVDEYSTSTWQRVASRQLASGSCSSSNPDLRPVFSPGGQYVVAEGMLLDLQHLQPIGEAVQCPGSLTTFSAGSAAIVRIGALFDVGRQTGAIEWTWTLDPFALADGGCGIARRNFTADEWQEFEPGQPYTKVCSAYPDGT